MNYYFVVKWNIHDFYAITMKIVLVDQLIIFDENKILQNLNRIIWCQRIICLTATFLYIYIF